ncbi:MAG: T9SS type A sorting domain-containing protein, partial [Rhodothermales bacterium]|nr:T9SS type A sorting domain-containing protein [Rhodothermales bacterium]
YEGADLVAWESQYWDEMAWAPSSRTLITYEGGVLTESVWQWWNEGTWMNYSRALFTYNGAGDSLEETWYDWDAPAGQWRLSGRLLYTYDDSARLAEVLTEWWNGTGWEDNWRTVYTYSGNNLIEFVSQSWTGSEWVNLYLMSQLNNDDGTISQSLHQFWIAKGGGYWYNSSLSFYAYAGATDADDGAPVAAAKLAVYPNPVRGTATVAFALERSSPATVEAYDVTGRRVATLPEQPFGAGEHAVGLDLSAFPAGVYFVRLRGTGTETTRSIVVVD